MGKWMTSECIGFWYCHVQRNFLPYGYEINQRIEACFRQYKANNRLGKSKSFVSHGNSYFVDFDAMEQVRSTDQHLYRTARRISFKLDPGSKIYQTKIPLSYAEILRAGGHPGNYLTAKEIADKRVDGEEREDFFPRRLLVLGICEDSFS